MLLKLILGLLLAGAAYFVAANSHFDIFPCKESRMVDDRTVTDDDSCSIMQVQREQRNGDRAELTPIGYATAVGVLGVAPMILGFVIGGFFTRKKL